MDMEAHSIFLMYFLMEWAKTKFFNSNVYSVKKKKKKKMHKLTFSAYHAIFFLSDSLSLSLLLSFFLIAINL